MFTIRQSPQQWRQFPDQNNPKSSSSRPPSKNQNPFPPKIISSNQKPAAGRIKRLVLTQQDRTKLNISPDREFYAFPRFVTHVDTNFISTLTNLYREILKPEMEILDLMSSWISHLPEEVKYEKVVGHGLNAQELARNSSVQYLQQPEKVFAEIFRVLKPGGVFIVSFSNRLFYEKAISAWRDGTAYSRVQLVVQYFQCVEGFTQPQIIRKLPNSKEDNSIFSRIMGLLGLLSGSDPFYAVVAYKNFKPIYE
ncbi:hypothetical protein DH2020_009490 [Rehmannia glutinosa]|uniref:Methyltransferase type 11 domain-containing protein n=1 Tax=Rehmannia glutinosa TaxID=99300 RepID=A0ABR0X6H0_REHGL